MVEIFIQEGPKFSYTDADGKQVEAVQKGNSLYTQEGTHLCDIHFNPDTYLAPVKDVASLFKKSDPKLNRAQRRSKKRSR